uniref:YLP motif-containing protein 1 n=1 Tax=Diabrotica virgifera virgifera TaxID=50390 RepID=A0A6P7F7E5_DIAVI
MQCITAEKAESEEEEGVDPETESSEDIEDCEKRTIKFKPFGGPLLAQTEISTSQQDFFKMLDDKIQNGPDYNSESESERAQETARLKALLKDWETASAGSRSLPATPKKRPPVPPGVVGVRSADSTAREVPLPPMPPMPPMPPRMPPDRVYVSQIPPSVIHQSYGVQPQYRQVTYNNPNYVTQSPSHQMTYPSAMQYQAISPMYSNQPAYQPPPVRQYPNYAQHASPIKTYMNNSANHIPYDQPVAYSPTHRLYGVPIGAQSVVGGQAGMVKEKPSDMGYKPSYTNGELLQQHMYSQQYQQYKEAREQVLAQNQQHPVVYRGPPKNYQSSVTIPIVVKSGQQSDANMLHRKQYELT